MSQVTHARTARLTRLLKKSIQVEWAPDLSLRHFLLITAQLGLLLAAFHLYQLEREQGFLLITPIVFGGFVIHAWLPKSLRRLFFLFVSFGAIGMLFRYPDGVILIVIGLGLIALCHLPIAFWMRVTLIVLSGGVLAGVRAEWIPTHSLFEPSLVLPVLGSIFMFRLIIYLYDLRHERSPAGLWERLSYFFMLPNVCFLLFPVIDYQTYRRTYYDSSPHEVYQKGVLWMFRGFIHLLLYRYVYYYLVPSSADVQGLWGVVQSMLATYALYLRISGQFHLIIGIMCLFGYNLPETHHLYYLASSFNDYWRRINIYWKDFMMKIFYYPSFMKLKQRGMMTALVISTILVFGMTWLLHSYQWFWLRGSFPITATDGLFWGVLGVFVVFNAVREAKRGRKRALGQLDWTFRGALVHSCKVVGMFVFICMLWSLWSSDSLRAWGALVAAAGAGRAGDWIGLFGLLALAVTAGVLLQFLSSRGWNLSLVGSRPPFRKSAAFVGAGLCLMLLVGRPEIHDRFGVRTSSLIASLQSDHLNEQDEVQRERGYYEGLLNADRFTSALWTVQPKPKDWLGGSRGSPIVRETGDLLEFEMLSAVDTLAKGVPFRTNSWGMHDQEYEQEKPPGTYRVALIGSSYAAGMGVDRSETFEAIAEARLNAEQSSDVFARYESLNFSVGGYSLLHNVAVTRQKAMSFEPDLLLLVIHTTEERRLGMHLLSMVGGKSRTEEPFLVNILEEAGVGGDMGRPEIERRLNPYKGQILRWAFEEIATASRSRGVTPAAVLIPATQEVSGMDQEWSTQLLQYADDAGFIVLNLEGAYDTQDAKSVQLALWDTHPNVRGHRLIGDRLFEELVRNREALGLEPAESEARIGEEVRPGETGTRMGE